jgi:lipocalin
MPKNAAFIAFICINLSFISIKYNTFAMWNTRMRVLVVSALVGLWLQNALAAECPPPGFNSVPMEDFDFQAYIAKPWYIQEQIPVLYQRQNQLYCVRAAYKQLDNDLVQVYNYANNDAVNGPPQVTKSFFRLLGKIPNLEDPSKLKVGIGLPFFNEPLFPGPYWVVAIDTTNTTDPQWAIVVGGPPDKESNGACLFQSSGFNADGFWLFSRKPEDPENTALMREKAEELGLDVSALLPVEQAGCTYEGAYTP